MTPTTLESRIKEILPSVRDSSRYMIGFTVEESFYYYTGNDPHELSTMLENIFKNIIYTKPPEYAVYDRKEKQVVKYSPGLEPLS